MVRKNKKILILLKKGVSSILKISYKDAILSTLAIGLFFTGIIFLWAATLKTPDLSGFQERRVAQSTKIYDRTGEILLYDIHENTRRTIVPYESISRNIKNATVAIEDPEFYQHNGIKPKAFLRAVIANISSRSYSQGGSTITQQVIKNSILTTEKKIARKVKEWILALKLEKTLTKEEILTFYLNESPYGGNIYGIEEASLHFFGKNAIDLSLGESAYLAAIPQAPTYYSPYGSNTKDLEKRKNLVLQKMYDNAFIKKDQLKDAQSEKVIFQPRSNTGIKAPHFVMYIKDYLERIYGKNTVEGGGLKVITTLDYELQEKAQEIVKRFALENTEKFNAENGSIVAVDTKTGQILVMVGSRDYFDTEIDGNFNIALAHRQPGSAFKPFVYATAFSKGYTPETIVFDLKTEFSTECDPDGTPSLPKDEKGEEIIMNETTYQEMKSRCYTPKNYDNVYRGPVTFRNALAQSINVPAIKALYLTGIKDSLNTAKAMGIKGLTDANRYGLTLVLGGGEVSLLEITNAYGIFSNEGIKNDPVGILKVEDNNGNIIESFNNRQTRVLDKQVALQISDVLSDEEARVPAFGRKSYLYFEDRDVAVKTGTTNDYRDAWIVGYTPDVSVGAWAGNNDNSSMEKKVAGFIVAPMWNTFMQEIINKYPNTNFEKYETEKDKYSLKPVLRGFWQGNTTYFIDKISKNLATVYTPEELKEEKVIKDIHSILYWVNKKDPRGAIPKHPETDSQFENWEYSLNEYLLKNNISTSTTEIIPTQTDTVHRPELSPKITVTQPSNFQKYNMDSKVVISFTNTNRQSRYPLTKADYYINSQYIGSSNNPFGFSFIPKDISNILTNNEIKVVVYDSVLNKGVGLVKFSVN
ncbi:transglycosylase domain-containing protein [Patescibacteria group bacterium]